MKIKIFLLVVLYGSTHVSSTEVSESPSTLNSTPKWNITFPKGALKNSSFKISYVPNPKNIKSECEKYGGSYEEALKAANGLEDCFHVALGPKLLDSSDILDRSCNNLPLLTKCSKNYVAVMNTCYDPMVRENNENLEKVFEVTLNFVCNNKMDIVSVTSNNKTSECLKSKALDYLPCMNSAFDAYRYLLRPAETLSESSEIKNLTLSSLIKVCGTIDTFRSCLVPMTESCNDSTTVNLFKSYFNHARKSVVCESLQGA